MPYSRKKKRRGHEAKQQARNIHIEEHTDLLLLRDAAVDERETITFHLKAAQEIPVLSEIFTKTAHDAMVHYGMLMHQINLLDPVQSKKMQNAGLEMLSISPAITMDRREFSFADIEQFAADKKLELIQFLTDALIGELLTANKYQTYIKKAEDESTTYLLYHLLTDLKEHIAGFTAALYRITGEPLQS